MSFSLETDSATNIISQIRLTTTFGTLLSTFLSCLYNIIQMLDTVINPHLHQNMLFPQIQSIFWVVCASDNAVNKFVCVKVYLMINSLEEQTAKVVAEK